MKIIICLILAIAMSISLCACDPQQARENTKEILKDVFIALPGGLREAKDRVLDPAIEDIKEDAKEIYDAAKPSWEEAFPGLTDQPEAEQQEEVPAE